jgi:hypothetical protein
MSSRTGPPIVYRLHPVSRRGAASFPVAARSNLSHARIDLSTAYSPEVTL